MFKSKLLIVFSLLLLSFSCGKKPQEVIIENHPIPNGILVLNEGLFQMNNSQLSFINLTNGAINHSFFENNTNRSLGDTGNDLARYGNKIYVVVNVSSTLEVLDATTGASIHQILMQTNGQGKQPRSIAFSNGKAFISCFDGFVDVFDTTNFNLLNRIAVGSNPDGICAQGNYIYTTNSGGLNYPNVDSTVSIINANSNLEEQRIVVGKNPGKIVAAADGNVYVHVRGDNSLNQSKLVKINTANTQTTTYPFSLSGMCDFNNNLLIYKIAGNLKGMYTFTLNTETLSTLPQFDISAVQNPYAFEWINTINKFYVFDAKNYTTSGRLYQFSFSGNLENSFETRLNPSKMLYFE